jgi:rRNA-processing protein FCF1
MKSKKHGSYKLAFDVSYSDKLIGRMARKGHQIVCVAAHGETDELWFARAMANGAEIVFSRDHDLIKLLAKRVGSRVRIINDEKNIMITSSPNLMDMFGDGDDT